MAAASGATGRPPTVGPLSSRAPGGPAWPSEDDGEGPARRSGSPAPPRWGRPEPKEHRRPASQAARRRATLRRGAGNVGSGGWAHEAAPVGGYQMEGSWFWGADRRAPGQPADWRWRV